MLVENLTRNQIRKICNKCKFIALRNANYQWIGYNCATIKLKKYEGQDEDVKTIWYSWKEISFMEYIRIKAPFI